MEQTTFGDAITHAKSTRSHLPLTLSFALCLAVTDAFFAVLQGAQAWEIMWGYLKTGWAGLAVGLLLQIWFSDEP